MKITRIAITALVAGSLALGAAAPAQASVPREYSSALASAQSYIRNLDMSKKGLYKQLTSQYGEGFPKKAAEYALKHVKVDYRREALDSAKSYQKNLHLSRSGIRKQLVSQYGEQFTGAQADWAMAHLPR